MISFPDQWYELLTVLHWSTDHDTPKKVTVKELVTQKLLAPCKKGFLLTIGTRRFGDGARVLLVSAETVSRILAYLLTLPAPSSAPSEPLLPLQPVSLRDYCNVWLVEYGGKKKIEAKLEGLEMSNRRRARKASEREQRLEKAREAADGEKGRVVAVSIVLHEKGKRRKKVMEIGWASWTPGGDIEVTHIKVEEFLDFKNGDKVPDRRDAFAFGNSEILPFEDARKLLLAEVHSTPKDPVNVVATSTQQLSALLRLPHLKPPLLDLDALFKSARHDQDVSTSILDLLSYYKVEHHPELLFNAGNNAAYLLEIFLELGRTE